MVSALIGSIGGYTYSSSVAMANASGIASRYVGFWTGGLLIGISAIPPFVGFFAFLPKPVMGAALVFAACFVLLNGLQIIASRLLDTRRIFVIGLALILGLSRDVFPAYYHSLPHSTQPFVSSDLVLALLVAMALNAIFRLGVRKRQFLSIEPGPYAYRTIHTFFNDQGSKWGARRDVIDRATFTLAQAVEIITEHCQSDGAIALEASFDDFRLDVTLVYDGRVLEFPTERPHPEEIIEAKEGVFRLGAYIIRRNADRVRAARQGTRSIVELHFQH
jgi:xanthine permease XanP